jgi:hypothetical protein
MQTQGEGDLYIMYVTSQRDGVDYNLAYIPKEFDTPHTREFDPHYMQSLYEFAYRWAADGNPWRKAPPGVRLHGGGEQRRRPLRS